MIRELCCFCSCYLETKLIYTGHGKLDIAITTIYIQGTKDIIMQQAHRQTDRQIYSDRYT